MNPTLALLFFAATTPIIFMPTVIALLTRHAARWWIVGANVALWAGLFAGVRAFSLGASSMFRLPTYAALLAWLAVLAWSVRARARHAR